MKKYLSILMAWTLLIGSQIQPTYAAYSPSGGDLVKGSLSAVYYVTPDRKRMAFPNEPTYFSWYADFSNVKLISDNDLAALPLAGLVTLRPGTSPVRVMSDPVKIYAIADGGVLRWIQNETVATAIFGADWAKKIIIIPDAFYTSYKNGKAIVALGEYWKNNEMNGANTIANDLQPNSATSSSGGGSSPAVSGSNSGSTGLSAGSPNSGSGSVSANSGSTGGTASGQTPSAPAPSSDGLPPMAINCTPGSSHTYDVGPGKTYATIGAVPWYALGSGDTVRIFWQATPYHEQILISGTGTAEAPIRVCGVAGPNGELPVLSGENAIAGPNLNFTSYLPNQEQAIIAIERGDGQSYYYKPAYITIEGLAVSGANQYNQHTRTDGTIVPWGDSASSIAVVGGDNITVRGCTLSDSGMGFFTLSKDEVEATLVRNVLLEGNNIFGNGTVGSWLEHNVYTQTLGVTVQFNRFGRLRDGSLGGNLKDRSAGTVVRYNYIEGTARLIDLVDAQEHIQHALADPRYRETFVYGNILISGPNDAERLVHYGGDTEGFEQNFRKGTLYFYNNTVIMSANKEDFWYTIVVDASTNDEHVDMRNNAFVVKGTTQLLMLSRTGQLNLGVNWITAGYANSRPDFTGTVTGGGGVIVGTDPILDVNLRPLAGSPLIDKASALAPAAAISNPILNEYDDQAKGKVRNITGSALDIGAFESL